MNKTMIDETKFITMFCDKLIGYGFEVELSEIEGYPLSVEGKLLGYEDTPITFVALFAPAFDVLGESTQMLQIYFSLYDLNQVSEEKYYKLKMLSNECNVSSPVGLFGVQDDINTMCYKQGLLVSDGMTEDILFEQAMVIIKVMATTLDKVYDRFFDILDN